MEQNNISFESAIKSYLDNFAATDVAFAKKYSVTDKSIKDCCKYIMGEAKKRCAKGKDCVALSDEEVYGLAVHFFDEVDVAVKDVNASVVVGASANDETEKVVEKPKATRKRKAKVAPDPDIPETIDIPLF